LAESRRPVRAPAWCSRTCGSTGLLRRRGACPGAVGCADCRAGGGGVGGLPAGAEFHALDLAARTPRSSCVRGRCCGATGSYRLAPKNGRTHRGAPAVPSVRPCVAYSHKWSNASGIRPGAAVVFDLVVPMETEGRTLGNIATVSPAAEAARVPRATTLLTQPPGGDRATINRPPNPGRPGDSLAESDLGRFRHRGHPAPSY
jgi:hypothetical protein